MSFEINVPASYGAALWGALMSAGEKHGITPQSVQRKVQQSLHSVLQGRELNANLVKEGGDDFDVTEVIRELEASGEYRIEVTSRDGGAGEYILKASWKTPKKQADDVALAGGLSPIEFGAGAGPRVNLKAVAAKGSDAVPQIVSLYQGGVLQLYQYKVYDDVRLVCMPHLQAAHFGRGLDNN